MKSYFVLSALLFSILFWGVNSAAFAQDQVPVKKTVVKKVEMKKDTLKKGVMKKVESKKVEMKKDVNDQKDGVQKEVKTTKTVVKKDVSTVKSEIKDKVVGKTADGKTIYEGPKGGKYTLSATGKKVYIKKDVKENK